VDTNAAQAAILQNHVDSVIRTFDMSLSIEKPKGTDPVHFDTDYYQAMMHLQIAKVYHIFTKKNKHNKNEQLNEYWFKTMTQ
jgi:hypothetical protein